MFLLILICLLWMKLFVTFLGEKVDFNDCEQKAVQELNATRQVILWGIPVKCIRS